MKRFCTLLFTLGMLLTLSLTASSGNRHGVNISLDGAPLDASGAYITDGTTMVPLRLIAESLGCNVVWDSDTRTVHIASAIPAPPEDPSRRPLVVLDPGHGGSSHGAEYGGVLEKDLNLAIATQAAQLLEEAGVAVQMTRTDDQDVDLYARTDLANELGAALFVSVHCNANTDHNDASGIYTCSYSQGTRGWRLAQLLHQTMRKAANAPDFGMEERPNLAVLRTSLMPAALVECGFMSTESELALLVQPAYQALLAQGIANGILAYLAQ